MTGVGTVKIGLHYIPMHGRPEDMDAVRDCPAPSVKVVYSSRPDADHLRRVHDMTGDRLIVIRDHAMSEQYDDVRRDPAGTGKRHAQDWAKVLDAMPWLNRRRLILEGINEPPVWEPPGPDPWVEYYLAFGDENHRLGQYCGIGELPVGWPGNGGVPDAPQDWTPYLAWLTWVLDHPGNFLHLHEYWGYNRGVRFNLGWWLGGYRSMPVKVPTMITEIGGLKAVQDRLGNWGLNARDGWMGDTDAHTYLEQVKVANEELERDPYIHSAHLFSTDGAHPWIEECDAGPINAAWIDYARAHVPAKPSTLHLPSLVDGPANPPANPGNPPMTSIIEPAAAAAVLDVESGGIGFDRAGRPRIRFEAHIFRTELKNPALFEQHFRHNAERPWTQQEWRRSPNEPWRAVHVTLGDLTANNEAQWEVFNFARSLNAEAAARSISVGAGQIMGFNAQRVGYASAQHMLEAFGESMGHQMIGFFNYILSDPNLLTAMRNRDWLTIARLYNGTGQAEYYADLIRKKYDELN